MANNIDLAGLAEKLVARDGRTIVAIAGPPGAGKSTFADALRDHINRGALACCEVFPMDGFHFDDTYLTPMGWQARKGAPYTFDVGGFRATLARLQANIEPEIAVPVFDRELEIARAGARMIKRETRIIIVEGNYLLLNTAPWSDLREFFDLSVMLEVPIETLKSRLYDRWAGFGFSVSEAKTKVAQNDLVNVLQVIEHSSPADYIVKTEG